MKKAIILEVKRKYALAMNEDKRMVRLVRKPNMNVDHIIYYFPEDYYVGGSEKTREQKKFFRLAFTSFCMLFFILASISRLSGPIDQPYGLVTFDVNPSVEIFFDANEQVKYLEALNEDGRRLIEGYLEEGKTLEEVLEYLTVSSVRLGYLIDRGSVLVSYTVLSNQSESAVVATSTIEKYIQEHQDRYTVVYAKTSLEDVKKAQKSGVSVGKYILTEEIRDKEKDKGTDKDIEFEEFKVSELVEYIEEDTTLKQEMDNQEIEIYPSKKSNEQKREIEPQDTSEKPDKEEKVDNPNKPDKEDKSDKANKSQ